MVASLLGTVYMAGDLMTPAPFFPQINNRDKDFRYMATSDLLAELGRDSFRVDPDMERKLSVAVLNQLEDPSGDISGLAVKWRVCLLDVGWKVWSTGGRAF